VLLNSTVLVQSKASGSLFPGETADGFHYLCDQRDLELWLGGNAPVILVLSHPDSDEAWWVDVKAVFPDAKSRLNRRVDVIKARDVFDVGAASALLSLGVPRSAGLYLPPTPRPETLTSNLQEVLEYPKRLFLAPATSGSYREVGEALREQDEPPAEAWLLTDGMIMSFADLSDGRWSPVLTGDVEVHDTDEWALSDEKELEYRFTALALRALQNSYTELRWHKDRRHVHFKATSNLKPLKVGAGPGSSGRTVFGPHGKRSDGTPSYYHHAAAQLHMRRFAGRWYVEITPDWCFTSDGWRISPRIDTLASGIKRLERHAAVRGWVRAWSRFFSASPDLFTEVRPIVLGELLSVKVEHGIDDKYWGPAPAGADEADAPLTARTSSRGVDRELDALLSGGDDESAGDGDAR
ncbi:MAG: DUF4365 domain-containing protein, partial [Actinobacteria bacterium]|nr:DUF4365 domain-containing protein [Actinomycetota bacterium]